MRTLALAVACLALGLAGPGASAAPGYSDNTAVSTEGIQAHIVDAPSSLVCVDDGLLQPLDFEWPNEDIRHDFVVAVEAPVGTVRKTEVVANNGTVGSPQSISYSPTFLSEVASLGTIITVRVRSRLADAATWTSEGSVTAQGRVVSLVGLGLSTSCV